jgi:hypothetical protein
MRVLYKRTGHRLREWEMVKREISSMDWQIDTLVDKLSHSAALRG